ncbi:MAG: protein kinase [Polyangiaceae bacterium]|nr:protein kinase [Polyangiaceae bacterium]
MSDELSRPVPERLADFEIIRRLGAGGMAEVFLAKKRGAEGTHKLLVLKRVLPAYVSSRRFRAMFAEEAQLATRLNHPNIVQVYDFQDYGDEGQLLSMEYVEGPDLRKIMRASAQARTRVPPWVAAHLIAEVAKGLHYAHERRDERGAPIDIVHRDVSPQNILLSFEGAVKIADFGIASANLFREEPGVLKGKTAYMSPEQARAEKVDRRSDLYSLGVVFHELLTGRPLHGAADGQELLDAVRSGNVEPPSTFAREVPAELEAIVMKALAKTPQERFQTGRDLAGAVSRALFTKQQFVDSHTLETVIGQLVSREHTSPGIDDLGGSAAESQYGDGQDSQLSVAADDAVEPPRASDEPTGPGRPLDHRLREHAGREVRHVAVVTIRLQGLEELAEQAGRAVAEREDAQLRGMLDQIAYKRGARLTWVTQQPAQVDGSALPHTVARAVVGLMDNPARASADAAWLAVDVHESIAGACDHLQVKLQASVGIVRAIATGRRDKAGHLIDHALQAPADYLANLLGERAPAGRTWVAGGLYRLVRRDFVWEDAPTIAIDDAAGRRMPGNMRIYSLVRPFTRDERQREAHSASHELIGRDAELGDLQAAFHHAMTPNEGGPGAVTARVVYGEMGIGKSALVGTFLAELPSDVRVLRVESSPARSELPFSNVAEWVRQLTGIRGDEPLDSVRQGIAEWMSDFAVGENSDEMILRLAELVVGQAAQVADEGDAARHRKLVATGIRRFLAKAALESPVLVVIEGLQWCDRPSLELVTELIRRGDRVRLLALLVTRPDDRVAPFIEGMVRIELMGLSPEHQLQLVSGHIGATAGVAQVCADLIPRAAGNPFFLLEMVDALLERGALELREGEDGTQELVRVERPGQVSDELPSTLEQLIADRLSELPEEEQRIMGWLAVAGGPLAIAELDRLCDTSTEDAVARLCARGLCDSREDGVDVRHPLARDVAYRALDKLRASRMHRGLGERLRETPLAEGLTAALVARHMKLGGERVAAGELYLRAARAARDSYQTKLAMRYYKRAVALLPEAHLGRLDAHEALENVFRVQGRWRDRRKHLALLRRLARLSGKPHWVATALLRTARFELDEGHLARGLVSAQQAEQVARASEAPLLEVQADVLMAEMLRDLGDMQGALAACDRAVATCQSGDVPTRLRADVLRTRGTLLRRVGRVHEAVDAHAEAIALFRQVGARRMEARAKNSLAFALFVLNRFEDAIALALDAIRIDLAIGGRFQIAKTLSNIGQCYARLGDTERGVAYLKRAREAHERYGDQDARADTLLCTAEVLLEMGDVAAADTFVGDAGALTAVTGSAYDSVHEKILRALLARLSGDSSTAVMHAFDARQAAEAQAYVAFHFYAMAVESVARVDIGESHTGILLATTAMGAIETVQGSEYGLETRALCCEALENAGSPQVGDMKVRAERYVLELLRSTRDPELRRRFAQRPVVRRIVSALPEELLAPPAEGSSERLFTREGVQFEPDKGSVPPS